VVAFAGGVPEVKMSDMAKRGGCTDLVRGSGKSGCLSRRRRKIAWTRLVAGWAGRSMQSHGAPRPNSNGGRGVMHCKKPRW